MPANSQNVRYQFTDEFILGKMMLKYVKLIKMLWIVEKPMAFYNLTMIKINCEMLHFLRNYAALYYEADFNEQFW